jgi:tRNA 2-thiouridine synthesizing protein A
MADEEKVKVGAQASGPVDRVLDLRGVACPLSWAKARVALDGLARGQELVLLLDEARALRDIPRAAEAQGYAVDAPVEVEGGWTLRIVV